MQHKWNYLLLMIIKSNYVSYWLMQVYGWIQLRSLRYNSYGILFKFYYLKTDS